MLLWRGESLIFQKTYEQTVLTFFLKAGHFHIFISCNFWIILNLLFTVCFSWLHFQQPALSHVIVMVKAQQKAAMAHADVVLKGTVISRTVTSTLTDYGIVIKGDSSAFKFTGIPIAAYKIKVSSIFKGKQNLDTVTILTPVNGAACGIRFTIGKEWIIYASTKDEVFSSGSTQRFSTNDGAFWTNQCTRTEEWFAEEESAIKSCLK